MSAGKLEGGRLYGSLGLSQPFDPDYTFVSAPIFSPLVLAVFRLTIAFYALFVVLFTLIWESVQTHDAETYFSYFTHLSYIGLLAYYWAAGVQTLVFALRGRYLLRKWYRPLQFLHTLLYSTITTFPFIVTIAFWALLTSSSTFASRYSTWSNVSVHAMNSGMALFEIVFAGTLPLPWIHLPFTIIFLAGYVAVAYITRASQGFYPYPFLDPHKQHAKVAVYVFGIGIAEVIIFVVVHFFIKLRNRLSTRHQSVTSSSADDLDEQKEVDHKENGLV